MLSYLQKFNNLPQQLREKISTPAIIAAVDELEKKYEVGLAATVMKIMVKEIAINQLNQYFVNELKLDNTKVFQLVKELEEKVLFTVAEYLGIKLDTASQEIKKINSLGAVPPVPISNERVINKPVEQKEKKVLTQASSSFFSQEDEAEINELAAKINSEAKDDSANNKISENANEIIKQAQINFSSEILSERFKNILITYLRGIRDKIDTQQTLMRSLATGGLGLDQASVDKIMMGVNNFNNNQAILPPPPPAITKPLPAVKNEYVEKKEESIFTRGRDIDYNLSLLKDKRDAETKDNFTNQLDKLDLEHELAPPPPARRLSRETRPEKPNLTDAHPDKLPAELKNKPAIQDNATEQKLETPILSTQVKEKKDKIIEDKDSEKEISELSQVDARQTDGSTGKIKMDDVKFKPKAMGPVDELRYLDIASFRRLSQDPAKIVEKIIDKINLLEEDGYAKRLEGIKAWRNSPVNKLYLEMGHDSISKNSPINDIIKDREGANNNFLTSKEFEAVTDLNRELRF